jgi:ribosomal protein S12 methylthiotransferase
VGFPGETRSEFQALMDFIQEIQFDHLGVFIYSDAEDLPSHGLEGHVNAKTARDRRAALMETQKVISTRALERHYDTQMSVLVEAHPEPHLYVARSALQAPEVDGCVYVTSEKPLKLGEFVTVRITDTLDYDLTGEPP